MRFGMKTGGCGPSAQVEGATFDLPSDALRVDRVVPQLLHDGGHYLGDHNRISRVGR